MLLCSKKWVPGLAAEDNTYSIVCVFYVCVFHCVALKTITMLFTRNKDDDNDDSNKITRIVEPPKSAAWQLICSVNMSDFV